MNIFGRKKRKKPQHKTKWPSPKRAYANKPPGLRAYLLRQAISQEMPTETMKAYTTEANRIDNEFSKQNTSASRLEKAGKLDKAIKIYESMIADLFDGSHPYTRLRIIYSKQKRYEQAIRVCAQFINMTDQMIKLGSSRKDLRSKRQQFREWKVKLGKK